MAIARDTVGNSYQTLIRLEPTSPRLLDVIIMAKNNNSYIAFLRANIGSIAQRALISSEILTN